MKIVINKCFGGFGLSEQAYEQLIEWGVPVLKYETDSSDEQIYDRELTPPDDPFSALYHKFKGTRGAERYWDNWTSQTRTHPLLLRVVEELGDAANGPYAKLKIVDVPDGVEWHLDYYDGIESVEEVHRSWA